MSVVPESCITVANRHSMQAKLSKLMTVFIELGIFLFIPQSLRTLP